MGRVVRYLRGVGFHGIGGFAALLALTAAGCGTDPGPRDARFLIANYPDSLDPQLAFSAEAWQALANVYVPLLTFARTPGIDGTEVIPALATDLPRISKDGRRYSLTLQDGLEFADGQLIVASDFERAMERIFELNSPGTPFYSDIVGAEDFDSGRSERISGIDVDDREGTIQIELKRPRGTFTQELALLLAAPVPSSTPAKDQSDTPIPASGPLELTDIRPGRGFALTPNTRFERASIPDLRQPGLDRIDVAVERNPSNQATQVEQGDADFMLEPPPVDRLADIESAHPDRFRLEPTASTYFLWMNTERPPFDDVRVRRAINYAIDPAAIEKIYGGLLEPSQQILPPLMPGHEEFTPYPHDPDKARELLSRADPEDTDVTVWTTTDEPNDRVGAYYRELLADLGFEAELREVSGATYFDTIGNSETPDLDTGFSNWFQSYPHPNDFFEPAFHGASISETHNNNVSSLDVGSVNREISRLAARPLDDEATGDYAALDRKVMHEAPWAPLGSRVLSTFTSERVDFERVYYHPVFGHDYASFSLEE